MKKRQRWRGKEEWNRKVGGVLQWEPANTVERAQASQSDLGLNSASDTSAM